MWKKEAVSGMSRVRSSRRTLCNGALSVVTAVTLCTSALAEDVSKSQIDVEHLREDTSTQTIRQCRIIAAHANMGAKHLHAINLVAHGANVDLYNDGHSENVTAGDQGTAHGPVLLDAKSPMIENRFRDDYNEAARWTYELSVLSIGDRIWTAAWDEGVNDDLAALKAATDGRAVCLFQTHWLCPTPLLVRRAVAAKVSEYQDLLMGGGKTPPTGNVTSSAVQLPAALSPSDGWALGSTSWRVDLTNSDHPVTVAQVEFASSAGRGMDFTDLGLIEGATVSKLAFNEVPSLSLIAPFSNEADNLRGPGWNASPVIGSDHRAYLLLTNSAPNRIDRVTALFSISNGTNRLLARLVWRIRNELVAPRLAH